MIRTYLVPHLKLTLREDQLVDITEAIEAAAKQLPAAPAHRKNGHKGGRKPDAFGTKWTPKDVEALKALLAKGTTRRSIAKKLHRTRDSIDNKIFTLGLHKTTPQPELPLEGKTA